MCCDLDVGVLYKCLLCMYVCLFINVRNRIVVLHSGGTSVKIWGGEKGAEKFKGSKEVKKCMQSMQNIDILPFLC